MKLEIKPMYPALDAARAHRDQVLQLSTFLDFLEEKGWLRVRDDSRERLPRKSQIIGAYLDIDDDAVSAERDRVYDELVLQNARKDLLTHFIASGQRSVLKRVDLTFLNTNQAYVVHIGTKYRICREVLILQAEDGHALDRGGFETATDAQQLADQWNRLNAETPTE